MLERTIAGGLLVGLLSLAGSIFAFVSRNTGPCNNAEGCRVAGAVDPHPYTAYGYALVAIGLLARRTAG